MRKGSGVVKRWLWPLCPSTTRVATVIVSRVKPPMKTTWGNALFGTAPIPLAVWLFILPFALGMLALKELRKYLICASIGNSRTCVPAFQCALARAGSAKQTW